MQVTVVADKSKSAMVIIIPACMYGACCCRMTGAREIGADADCLKMLKEAMVRYGHDQRGGQHGQSQWYG